MKYILMCLGAMAVCVAGAWLPVRLLRRKKGFSRTAGFFGGLGFALLLMLCVSLGYLGVYYHADASAAVSSETVEMQTIDGGWFFDGPGEERALIFYPGAKVEALAYAPLMTALAQEGVDCFLADMPFRMAIFGSELADRFLNAYSYDSWSAAGHSMGGLVISSYAADHTEEIENLILLAAYPGQPIPNELSLCSVYGTKDGCLNREVYDESRENWPENAAEFIIDGGNHAQYAAYGPQSGDMDADISREEQQRQTVEIILEQIR